MPLQKITPYSVYKTLKPGADAGFVKRGGRVSKFVKRGAKWLI